MNKATKLSLSLQNPQNYIWLFTKMQMMKFTIYLNTIMKQFIEVDCDFNLPGTK